MRSTYLSAYIYSRRKRMSILYAEARSHYEKALQMGKKEGGHPAVLDEILENAGIKSSIGFSLGIQSVNLDQIVGTKTAGRKSSFSKSFYPLLKPESEFGNKWINLCKSHLEEGIHDPIKVYEYLNEFYVLEGNKRLSVLRYFDSVSIRAEIQRLMPPQTDRPEIQIYYEFVDFNHLSQINYIYFTKKGSFAKLQRLVGKKKDEYWSDEDRMHFSSFFGRFRNEYIKRFGRQHYTRISDAFLTFISIYDYDKNLSISLDELKKKMEKCKDEFLLALKEKPSEVQMDPYEKKKSPILQLISGAPKHLKIAFIHDRTSEESAWTFNHDIGRIHVEKMFPENISTTAYFNTTLDNIEETLENAIEEGHQVVFTTSPIFLKATLKVSVEHPEIKFLNCTTHLSYKHVRTYYARMYEVKFLMGALAGSLTENDKIGYIADYPIYGTISNINSFALGAIMVNPRARIYLQWSRLREHAQDKNQFMEQIYDSFRQEEISIICDKDSFNSTEYTKRIGLYKEEKEGFWNIAMPIWDWSVFYEKEVTNILNGNWKTEENKEKGQGISYWWGISSGIVDIVRSSRLPIGTKRLLDLVKDALVGGTLNPFSGTLYSQNGLIQSESKAVLSPEQILTMDWLAENVIGDIPKVEDLNDTARTLTSFVGTDKGEHVL